MDNQEEKKCANKMAFDTKKEAQTAATVTEHQRGIKLEPYQCRECGLWHMATKHRDD